MNVLISSKVMLAALLCLFSICQAQGQVDIYMRWDNDGVAVRPMQPTGISAPGSPLKDWTKLQSLSFGVTNAVGLTSTTGAAGGGKAVFKGIEAIAATDINTPNLFLTCCLGGHYTRAVAAFHDRLTGARLMELEFFLVAVSEVAYTVLPGSTEPQHKLVMACGATRVKTFPRSKDGTELPPVSAEWSVIKNAETTAVE